MLWHIYRCWANNSSKTGLLSIGPISPNVNEVTINGFTMYAKCGPSCLEFNLLILKRGKTLWRLCTINDFSTYVSPLYDCVWLETVYVVTLIILHIEHLMAVICLYLVAYKWCVQGLSFISFETILMSHFNDTVAICWKLKTNECK